MVQYLAELIDLRPILLVPINWFPPNRVSLSQFVDFGTFREHRCLLCIWADRFKYWPIYSTPGKLGEIIDYAIMANDLAELIVGREILFAPANSF